MTEVESSRRPPASEILQTPGGLLTRSDLRSLGLERRAIDAVFRELDVVVFPGYTRTMIRAEDYLALLERSTWRSHQLRHVSWARVVRSDPSHGERVHREGGAGRYRPVPRPLPARGQGHS